MPANEKKDGNLIVKLILSIKPRPWSLSAFERQANRILDWNGDTALGIAGAGLTQIRVSGGAVIYQKRWLDKMK